MGFLETVAIALVARSLVVPVVEKLPVVLSAERFPVLVVLSAEIFPVLVVLSAERFPVLVVLSAERCPVLLVLLAGKFLVAVWCVGNLPAVLSVMCRLYVV